LEEEFSLTISDRSIRRTVENELAHDLDRIGFGLSPGNAFDKSRLRRRRVQERHLSASRGSKLIDDAFSHQDLVLSMRRGVRWAQKEHPDELKRQISDPHLGTARALLVLIDPFHERLQLLFHHEEQVAWQSIPGICLPLGSEGME
jgi:hypothetical protein